MAYHSKRDSYIKFTSQQKAVVEQYSQCQICLMRIGTFIESVDSICRDSVDTQYMAIQKNSQKQLAYKLFVFECFHDQQDSQWCEKASQKYQTKNSQNWPNVFLSSSFFFFRRTSSILREPLALVYTRNSSVLYGAVHNSIAFLQLRSLARYS